MESTPCQSLIKNSPPTVRRQKHTTFQHNYLFVLIDMNNDKPFIGHLPPTIRYQGNPPCLN